MNEKGGGKKKKEHKFDVDEKLQLKNFMMFFLFFFLGSQSLIQKFCETFSMM